MGKDIAVAAFDYTVVDSHTKSKLIALSGQVKRGKAGYTKSVLEIGAAIEEAHRLLCVKGKDGQFTKWVEGECLIERRTAYNYLWAHTRFGGNCATVSQFSPTAMYALASPTAPEAAFKEAVKRAEKGEKISKHYADELIAKHTVEADEPDEEEAPSPSPAPAAPTEPSADPEPEAESQAGGEDDPLAKLTAIREAREREDEAAVAPKMGRTEFDPAKIEAEANAGKVKDGLPDIAGLGAEYDAALNHLTQAKKIINAQAKHQRTGGYIVATATRITKDIDAAFSQVTMLRPTCLCHKCQGKACNYCHKTGFLTKQASLAVKG